MPTTRTSTNAALKLATSAMRNPLRFTLRNAVTAANPLPLSVASSLMTDRPSLRTTTPRRPPTRRCQVASATSSTCVMRPPDGGKRSTKPGRPNGKNVTAAGKKLNSV